MIFAGWSGTGPLGFLANPQLLTDLILPLPTTVCVGLAILLTPLWRGIQGFNLGLEAKFSFYLLAVLWAFRLIFILFLPLV